MTAVSNRYPTAQLRALDAAHHFHPFTDTKALNAEGSRIITAAKGVWLTDSDGNRILDGMAGLWCAQVGHGREEIADAVHRQMTELSYYNTFFKTTHPPVIALAEKLAEVSPPQFNRTFFCSSGSEANDTVFRMVRFYWDQMGKPEKKIIIGRWNGYHGSTLAGTSLGGMKAMHEQGDLPVPGVRHIPQPYWFGEGGDMSPAEFGIWAARELEKAIDHHGEDKVAAFIAEPIQGAGGVIIPPETYWPEVQRILKERDILFVADEVICGFGRLGTWFGSEYYGIEPDLMPIAKGLTSGYLPMGGVLVSDKVAAGVIDKGGEFYHGYTYSGHPACAAAALANLEIIQREKLVERVANDIGPYLQARWRALGEHPLVGEARMTGLVGALELVPEKGNRKKAFPNTGTVGTMCRDISFRNGLIMRAVRDSMIISPPLVITHGEADQLVAIAKKTLDDTHAELKRRGMI
ncbi:aminotransferase class III-fold pyridoxal phosphate-dependent enzyme [Microvirga tunisiensis]|uniref:Aminotransferase class III-fold pyridoxal phosphate-dependent enzyme n=2 Tax=Pannonibacter tanglangensis TaxID=2750084 RepID=A0A7X5J8V8_9HYPH|nr:MULTISPECIES: aspartate aminotransferase family protein [unclassified Pannonibacter]NBN64559.1 aminotransferase class III-fold pyridoxal phosphate-dependent enzyme [Pannonibacter sp. XCT-34]NBN79094.1 aminotransferase class III-fold pyridoxal phosphate-dependent enzyme [Pannonibacter sp. XCT-53]